MLKTDSALFRLSNTANRSNSFRIEHEVINELRNEMFFFLLALQPPLGVVFYSPLVGFSLLACEVS